MPGRLVATIVLSILFSVSAHSQAERVFDSLTHHFAKRDSLFSATQLYLHTDKTIYTANDNIWFSGYLLRASQSLDQYHTLYVFLSRQITHEVVASEQFVMNQGLAAGYIFIADSFPPGDYNLVAYTNAIAHEPYPRVFQQQLSIRYGGGNPFSIELEGRAASEDSIGFLAHVTNKAMLNASGAAFNYTILADGEPMMKGRSVVNAFGEVPLVIPQDSVARKLELQVAVQKEKEAFATRIPLSFLEKQLSFRWYPESGDWVDGLPARTSFEVTDRSGKPAVVKGQLLEDNKPVAAFRSSANGLGIIEFTPVAGRQYNIVLDDSGKHIIAARIPSVKTKGAVMRAGKAVAGDTLVVKLRCTGVGQRFYLLIHNYSIVYDLWQLKINNHEATLRIPMAGLENGLGTLTLFDSTFQPLAERTFFKGYDSLASMQISTDSVQYHRRSKINLRIKMQDAAGNPLTSSFSMATVLNKRIDSTRFQDIVPYYFFKAYTDMGVIPRMPAYSLASRADMEMLLLVRCWTKYREPVADTATLAWASGRDLQTSGVVKRVNHKALKKPVEVSVLSGNGIQTINTDSTGYFSIGPELTALAPDSKLTLVVNEKYKEDFTIMVNHDADSLNKQLATLSYPEAEGVKAFIPWEEETLNKMKTLSEVVVKSDPQAGFKEGKWQVLNQYKSVNCGDYVCMNNILNCINHPGGMPAVDGETYNYKGRNIVYHCGGQNNYGLTVPAELLHKLKGRYYSKDFYVADYAAFNPPGPETLSTVYWSQQLFTDDKGEALVSFYTNDLTGIFSCIIEGITPQGVISGRRLIKVVE